MNIIVELMEALLSFPEVIPEIMRRNKIETKV